MHETFAERLLTMFHNNRFHDDSRSRAERRAEMPTEGFSSDIFLQIASDDRVTVRLSLIGDHPEFSRLVRHRDGGVFTKSAGSSIFIFPITDSDVPFIRKLYKALLREVRASRQKNSLGNNSFGKDAPGWADNAERVAECLEELGSVVEAFRESLDRAAERPTT